MSHHPSQQFGNESLERKKNNMSDGKYQPQPTNATTREHSPKEEAAFPACHRAACRKLESYLNIYGGIQTSISVLLSGRESTAWR